MKTNLWLLGTPYGDSKIHLRYYILVITLTIMVTLEGAFFISGISSENLLELTQLAPCIAVGLLSLLKVITIAQKREKIFELSESLRELYNPILANTNERQLVKHDLVLVKLLVKYFIVLNLVLISVYNFSSFCLMLYHYLITKEVVFMLPYAILLPFSTDSWIPWIATYLYSIICGMWWIVYFNNHFNISDVIFIGFFGFRFWMCAIFYNSWWSVLYIDFSCLCEFLYYQSYNRKFRWNKGEHFRRNCQKAPVHLKVRSESAFDLCIIEVSEI